MKFNEDKHTYFNDDEEQYLSATAFLKRFYTPFDREKRAKAYAKKHKRKVGEVLAEWDKIGKDAIDKGTFYHKMKEEELNNSENILIDEDNHKVFKPTWENGVKIHKSQKLETGVYPELIVWSDKYKIAGQADQVEITKKGFINIKDYKTSREIPKESYKRWDGTKTMMKFPLNNLEDCKFNQYSLQINLYAYFIKQQNRGLKIGKLEIEHVVGDFLDGVFTLNEIKKYKVPDFQSEIKRVLEFYKDQSQWQ